MYILETGLIYTSHQPTHIPANFCQTPVLGLGLGVDFTFAGDNDNKNHNHNNHNKNPHINFLKETVLNKNYNPNKTTTTKFQQQLKQQIHISLK